MNYPRWFRRVMSYINIFFFDGMLTLLPITLTIGLFSWVFHLLQRWLKPIYNWEPAYLHHIPYSEFLLVIFIIFLVGAIFRTYLIRSFLHILEIIVLKIPLVGAVYSGIKQLVQAFVAPDKLSFKKVILLEFPRIGIFSIGFLTNDAPTELAPSGDRYYLVFIPHTPNPTTGSLIMVHERDIRVIDLTRQEAMSLIISGGIIKPDRFIKK